MCPTTAGEGNDLKRLEIGSCILLVVVLVGGVLLRENTKRRPFTSGLRSLDLIDAASDKVGYWPLYYLIGDTGVYRSAPVLRFDQKMDSYFLEKDGFRLDVPLSTEGYDKNLSSCVDFRVNFTGILYRSFTGKMTVEETIDIGTVWRRGASSEDKLREGNVADDFVVCYAGQNSVFHPDAKVCVLSEPYAKQCEWMDKSQVPAGSIVEG